MDGTPSFWGQQDQFGLGGSDIFPGVAQGSSLAGLTGAEATGGDMPGSVLPGLNPTPEAMAGIAGPDVSGLGGLGGLLSSGGKITGDMLNKLLGPLFGLNPSGAGGIGGEVGGVAGGAIGSIFGPAGTFAGSALGDLAGSLIGNWVGGGVPSMAKTDAFRNALFASGDPLQRLLGMYMMRTPGTSLSSTGYGSTGGNTARMANILQLLSGEGMPLSGGKVAPFGGALGFQHPVELGGVKNINALMGMFPGATHLSLNQLEQILPELSRLVNRSGGMNLRGLTGESEQLAEKLKAAETY